VKKRAGPITAAELMADLGKDPNYVRMMAAKQRSQAERQWRLRQFEEPLLNDLREAGFRVNSVWDLVNAKNDYDAAIKVLLAHIRRKYPSVVLEGIGRALGIKAAKPYWNQLVELYRRADHASNDLDDDLPVGSLKVGLAVAIAAISDRELFDETVALLRDRSNIGTRGFFVFPIARSGHPRRWQVMEELAEEPDLKPEIAQRIKLRDKRRQRKAP
jgi:HEAT repeat protein